MSFTKNDGSADADSRAIGLAFNSVKVNDDMVAKSKEPFRYRWQKKKDGQFAYQDALVLPENADSTGDFTKVAHPENFAAMTDDESDNDLYNVREYPNGKPTTSPAPDADLEESDVDFKVEEGSDDDYETSTAFKKPSPGKKPKNLQKYVQKNKKPNPNGRVVGRKLVMWHRPRMVEKLLLHLQYECHRAGLKLPWDKAVERLSTGSSGASALQHINKLRDILITEGHLVPPLLGKYTVPQDPAVRGYMRDIDAEKPTDTRVVRWGEHIEDRKENLEVEGVVRGSGNYRRGLSKALDKVQKATGTRRNRLPAELREGHTESNGTAGIKIAVKRRASVFSSRSESLDPAEMDSGEEYDPSAAKKKGKYGLRKVSKPISKYKVEDSDDEVDEEIKEEPTRPFRRVVTTTATTTPRDNRLKECGNSHGLITPPSTKPVILSLHPDILKRFPSGTGLKNEGSNGGAAFDAQFLSAAMDQDVDENGSAFNAADYGNSEGNGKYRVAAAPPTSIHPLAQQMARHSGYQGMAIHGLKVEYDDAICRGLDPKINGLNYKKSPVTNSQAVVDDEIRVSSVHKFSAPPAYSPNTAPHKLNNALLGSSDSTFPMLIGSTYGNAAIQNMTFDQYVAGYRSQSNTATHFGNGQQMMVDGVYPGNSHYTSGSDIFQVGINKYSTGGLEYGNFDGNSDVQAAFNLSVNYGRSSSSNIRAPAATSSTIDVQRAADPAATRSFDTEITGDTLSEAHSSPAHYADYIPEDGDDKENHEWFDGYAY